ncbi:MAG: sugar phosphate isomerase/epimerase family protein [Planctomycetota bacterium]
MLERLVASPCSNPALSLEEALAAYAEIGFRKFEAFTSWCKSALNIDGDPDAYRNGAERHGLRFVSMHLPPVGDGFAASLDRAIQGAKFAERIGAAIVLFKATSRENYIRAARPFLDAIAGVSVTPVLQNHAGTPITSLEDFREVIEGINDRRMKTLLEVGHFHKVGVHWKEGYDLLGESIALVHIKDQIGPQPVPFGTGEIDLPGLFRHMRSVGYAGDYVVEMEVKDKENTLRYLAEAIDYVATHCQEETRE